MTRVFAGCRGVKILGFTDFLTTEGMSFHGQMDIQILRNSKLKGVVRGGEKFLDILGDLQEV